MKISLAESSVSLGKRKEEGGRGRSASRPAGKTAFQSHSSGRKTHSCADALSPTTAACFMFHRPKLIIMLFASKVKSARELDD